MEAFPWINYLVMGPLYLLIAVLINIFPPKKINSLYGYRTPLSMKNQASWDLANQYFNRFLLWVAIGLSIIDFVLFMTLPREVALGIAVGLLSFSLLGLIIATEVHLKTHGGRE